MAEHAVAGPEPIRWRDLPSRPCAVAETLDLVGDKWSMLIVRDMLHGVGRYEDLVRRLGISRATLADRLRRLTAVGIVEPHPYDDGRGRERTEYRLTERGRDLRIVLVALREWGDKHLFGEERAPLWLVERATDRRVHLELVDDETGQVVDAATVRSVPGPGFDAARADGGP